MDGQADTMCTQSMFENKKAFFGQHFVTKLIFFFILSSGVDFGEAQNWKASLGAVDYSVRQNLRNFVHELYSPSLGLMTFNTENEGLFYICFIIT